MPWRRSHSHSLTEAVGDRSSLSMYISARNEAGIGAKAASRGRFSCLPAFMDLEATSRMGSRLYRNASLRLLLNLHLGLEWAILKGM